MATPYALDYPLYRACLQLRGKMKERHYKVWENKETRGFSGFHFIFVHEYKNKELMYTLTLTRVVI